MVTVVASKKYKDSLYACICGYFRYDVKKHEKKIFSLIPVPFIPISIIVFIVLILLWYLLSKHRKKDEIEIRNFITRFNDGILISDEDEDAPGLMTGKKEELVKLIGIAEDKTVVSKGEVFNHIFFLLDNKDTDIFTDELLETIANKNVWIFIEGNKETKRDIKLDKIGKIILFDSEYMKTCGNPSMTLGLILRFLSMISREGCTNLDHVHEGLPDICTISYSYPTDLHMSLASVLKHQKHLCVNHNESSLQITNSEDIAKVLQGPARYVEADTEPFLFSIKEVL